MANLGLKCIELLEMLRIEENSLSALEQSWLRTFNNKPSTWKYISKCMLAMIYAV